MALRFDTCQAADIIQRMLNCICEDAKADATTSQASHEEPALAAMFRVLSDPTRLRIFDMLMEGVQCNCEIAEKLDLSLSLISHHLAMLRRVGLVCSERDPEDARWVYYSINLPVLDKLHQEMGALLDSRRIKARLPSCGPRGCGPTCS